MNKEFLENLLKVYGEVGADDYIEVERFIDEVFLHYGYEKPSEEDYRGVKNIS